MGRPAAQEALRRDLQARATRSVHYHEARARFLDLSRRLFDFMVIIGGATATSSVIGSDPKSQTVAWVGLFVAVVGSLQLVLGLGERAQEHRWLQKRVAEILGKLYEFETFADWSERDLRELMQKLAAVYADEPPTLRALDAICHNTAHLALATEARNEDLLVVPWPMAWTAHLWPYTSHHFLTAAEKKRQKP